MRKTKKGLLILLATFAVVCFSIGLCNIIPVNQTVAAAVPGDEYIVVEPGGAYDANRLLEIDENGRWTGIKPNYMEGETSISWPSNMGKVHLILPTKVKTIAAGTSSISGINADQYPISKISFADEKNSLFERIESSTVTEWAAASPNATQNLNTGDVLPGNLGGAFDGNTSLHEIIFPDNGKHQTIGAFAFHRCSSPSPSTGDGLQHVEFRTTGGVTIERGAFALCYGLRAVDSNTAAVTAGAADSSIGEFAFSRCHKLYRAVFPSNLKSIGRRAFSHIYGSNTAIMLTDLAIGNEVVSIGESAFNGAGLIRFIVPEKLTAEGIGADAFANCKKLVEVKNNSEMSSTELVNCFGTSVMNFYGKNTGKSDSLMLRDGNGVVFCRNSAGRWSVTSYADIFEHQFKTNRLLLKLPNGLSDSTARWTSDYTYKVVINGVETTVFQDGFAAKGEYDYLDYDGTPVKNSLSETVTEYDIGPSAFSGVWMPYIEIPDSVVNIGNGAFKLAHVVSVVLGEGVKSIGDSAFHSNSSSLDGGHPGVLTVYMPKNYSQISYSSNAFYGDSAYIARFIYKDKADYDASATKGVRPKYNNGTAAYTYLMPVTYHVLDVENNEIGAKTVEKVNSLGYNYTRNEVNVWEIDAPSETSKTNALPNINDIDGVGEVYSSTVWYTASSDGANYFQASADNARVNSLVRDDNRKTAKLDLYAKKVDIPNLTDLERVYDGASHTITSLTGLDETAEADYGITMTYADSSGAEQGARKGVSEAGVYTLTVTLNTAWGVWTGEGVGAHKMTITVKKAKINLADNNVLSWDAWDVSDESAETPVGLLGGILYVSGQSNISLQPNGGTETPVASSYVRFLENRTVSLRVHGHEHYKATEYFYTQSANRVGMWDTQATLQINDADLNNYEFSSVPVEGDTRNFGVRVVLAADGTATVTKTWYIVQVGNWITAFAEGGTPNEDSPEYTLSTDSTLTDWEYGSNIAFNTPDLVHGDKQNIKFTLTRNGEVAGDADKLAVWDAEGNNAFVDYFNNSIPAGEYVLTIEVDSLTVGSTTYPSIERVYRFKVLSRSFTQAEKEIVENALKGVTFEYLQDGTVHIWEGGFSSVSEADKTGRDDETYNKLQSLLAQRGEGSPWHVTPEGVWAGEEYADLYKPASLTYNLYRMQNNDYVADSYFNGASTTLLKGTSSYTVYYQFSAPSYEPIVDVSSDVRRSSYFNVVIYQILEIPDYAKSLVYTGSRNTPYIAGSDYYAIDWDSSDSYVDANKETEDGFTPIIHKIVLRSYDKNLYRWAEAAEGVTEYYIDPDDSAKMVLTYTITPAENRWTTAPRIVAWTWSFFDGDINRIMAVPYYGAGSVSFAVYKGTGKGGDIEYNEKITEDFVLDENGNIPETVSDILKSLNSGNYQLRAWVETSANFSGVSDQPFDFVVSPATNRWDSTPNLIRWTWSGYDKTVNLITAIPFYTDPKNGQEAPSVRFTVLDKDKNEISALLTGFTSVNGLVEGSEDTEGTVAHALANLPRGTYYLRTELAATDNYTAIPASVMQFEIGLANNYWQTSPGMTGWQYKGFTVDSNFIEGLPKFIKAGESVNYVIYKGKTAPSVNQNPNDQTDKAFTEINEEILNYLTALGNGDYWLVATVDGTNDFTGLRMAVPFTVSPATSNAWGDPAPSITGWIYKEFKPELVTEGKVTHGTLEYTLFKRNDGDINSYDSMGAGYENLTFAQLLALLSDDVNPFGAGYYKLTVRTVVSEDYAQASRDLFFIVQKAENHWKDGVLPDIESWIWSLDGSTVKNPSSAETLYENGGVDSDRTGYYSTVRNASGLALGGKLDEKPMTAGTYAYVTKFAASDNYKEIEHISYFTVWQLDNEWLEDKQPEAILTWTWGNPDVLSGFAYSLANSALVNASAAAGEPVYVIRSGNSNSDPILQSGILEALSKLDAGTYSVSITVAEDLQKYTGLTAVTSVTVNKASFTWTTAPQDAEWEWNPKDDSQKLLVIPEAAGVNDVEISVVFTVDGLKYTSDTLTVLLFAADAGAYTVKATVSDKNYADFGAEFTVNVLQAENEWTANSPSSEIKGYYQNFKDSDVPALPSVKYGTVKYSMQSGGVSQDVTDIKAWLNGLAPGEYTLTVSVNETKNYKPLKEETQVTVNKIPLTWDNAEDALKNAYEFDYSSGLPSDMAGIVLPYKTGVNVEYSVSYKNYNEEKTFNQTFEDGDEGNALDALKNYLKHSSRNAGVYVITSVYTPDDSNYSTLSYKITVTVNRVTVAWDEGKSPKELIQSEFEEVEYASPVASGYDIVYTVTDSKGEHTPTGDIAEYLNTLGVGTYTITATVAGTDNNTELKGSTTLIITKAINSWKAGTELSGDLEYERLSESDILTAVPEAERGKIVISVDNVQITPDETVTDLIKFYNDYLKNLSAGIHNIVVSVAETPDYAGLRSETRLTVTKISNSWADGKAPKTSYSWEWKKEGGYAWEMPEARFRNEKLVFDVYDLNGNVKTDLTATTLTDYWKTLVAGTYRVISRVDENEDYDGLRSETTVSISKMSDGWKIAPELSVEWVWGDESNAFTIAEANDGELTFTVITGNKRETVARENLLNHLKGLDAGTYSVEASLAGDENHEALSGTTVLTINKVVTEWNNADELSEQLTWTKGGTDNPELKAPVSSWAEGATVISVVDAGGNSTAVSGDLNEYLKGLSAGTYTVIFSVTGDNNHSGITHRIVLTINKTLNSWVKTPADTVKWVQGGENTALEFEPNEGKDALKIYVDGELITGDLLEKINGLAAGTHTVRAEVEETDAFRALSKSITLNVVKGANGWKEDKGMTVHGWTWDNPNNVTADSIGWRTPTPLYGTVANIVVMHGVREVFSVTLNYPGGVVSAEEEASLIARICALDASDTNYTIRASIPESDRFASYVQDTISFKVLKATNVWAPEPTVQGWIYGQSQNQPVAGVKYGKASDIVYEYTYEGAKVTSFDKAGTYSFTATLEGTENYTGLTATGGTFVITHAKDNWQISPRAEDWIWGKFDKSTNRFTAQPVTGRTVLFTVYSDAACNNPIAGLIKFSTTAGVVSAAQEAAFKGLAAGTYYYKAVVDEDDRYAAFGTETIYSFEVELAENGFTEYPSVAGWSVANWQASANKPAAVSEYGDITMTVSKIKSINNGNAPDRDDVGSEIYSGTLLHGGVYQDDRDEAFIGLMRAETGWYRLTAVTASESGHYKSVTVVVYFQVYQGSEARPANRWLTMPSMDSWTVFDENIPTIPTGSALRSTKVIYTYFGTKYEGGRYVIDEATATDKLPEAPGKYIVRIESENEENGVVIESDYMVAEIPFEIYVRQNYWTVDPAIESWELGTGLCNPVAEARYTEGGGIVYEYKLKGSDDSTKTTEKPSAKGEYVMIVTVTAKYCAPLEARVEFSVTLSQNMWIKLPVIESWTEETGPNNPTGEAAFGTIKYTYKTADGKDLGEVKPTAEGSYIMFATVEVDGYETLINGEGYKFTISAAYDTTLLTVDIVLASVLCALTVVVIIFAIRRYRENG